MVIFNFCASSDLAATLYELQKTPDDMKNDRMSAEEEANQPTTVPNPPTSTVKAVTEKVLEKAKNSQKQKLRKDKQKLILEETNTLPINPKMPINIGVSQIFSWRHSGVDLRGGGVLDAFLLNPHILENVRIVRPWRCKVSPQF